MKHQYVVCIHLRKMFIKNKLNSSMTGGRRINWFRNLPIWRLYAEYFPIRLIKTVDIPSDRNYIFGLHPHGILSFSHSTNFLTEGTNFSKLFPGIIPHLVTINMQFKLPIQRDLFLSAGACSASKESWNYILRYVWCVSIQPQFKLINN